jgi:hypothetical protein
LDKNELMPAPEEEFSSPDGFHLLDQSVFQQHPVVRGHSEAVVDQPDLFPQLRSSGLRILRRFLGQPQSRLQLNVQEVLFFQGPFRGLNAVQDLSWNRHFQRRQNVLLFGEIEEYFRHGGSKIFSKCDRSDLRNANER